MQDIASRGVFAYPTNLMSRFYGDPWVGAMAHLVLFVHDRHDEVFNEADRRTAFTSTLGKTKGAAAPHEFWYWWRRYFKFKENHGERIILSEEQRQSFRGDLARMLEVFDRPMAFKAMMTNWNIAELHDVVPEAVFVHIEREIDANACSLLKARETFYGNRNEWYAFKPPNIADLIGLDPEEQVFAQVKWTNLGIRQQLKALPSECFLQWRYEEFCADPAGHHAELMEMANARVIAVPASSRYDVPHTSWPSDISEIRVRELTEQYAH